MARWFISVFCRETSKLVDYRVHKNSSYFYFQWLKKFVLKIGYLGELEALSKTVPLVSDKNFSLSIYGPLKFGGPKFFFSLVHKKVVKSVVLEWEWPQKHDPMVRFGPTAFNYYITHFGPLKSQFWPLYRFEAEVLTLDSENSS